MSRIRPFARDRACLKHWASICVTIVILFAPAIPRAQSSSGQPTPEQIEKFEELLQQASVHYEQEEYLDAIAKYERARDLIDHPRLSLSIARARFELHHCNAAAAIYDELLRRDNVSEKLRDRISSAQQTLEQCTEAVQLEITCTPTSADVSADGAAHTCPTTLTLAPGSHTITVSADGFVSTQKTVTLEESNPAELEVNLVARQPVVTDDGSPHSSTQWRSYASWTSIGLGAASIITGFVIDIGSLDRAEKIAKISPASSIPERRNLRAEADSAQTATIVAYSAGAALVGAGLLLRWWPESDIDEQAARANPPVEFGVEVAPNSVSATISW